MSTFLELYLADMLIKDSVITCFCAILKFVGWMKIREECQIDPSVM